jgi:hypothetical protein
MLIQLNTDNHVDGNDQVVRHARGDLEGALQRFAREITRLEVHFRDANADKAGDSDKRCMIEARVKGYDPMAVTNSAATLTAAYTGARDKLVKLLDRRFDRLRNTLRRETTDGNELTP